MFGLNQNHQLDQAAQLLHESTNVYVITGAGISTSVGIPDLAHLPRGRDLSSEMVLESDQQSFYQGFHQIFIDPIFNHGPSTAHRILARWGQQGIVKGIVTTNVDYLHELAGSQAVADIYSV